MYSSEAPSEARPARKSLEERRPATGRSWNPVTLFKKVRHMLKLREAVLGVSAVLLEQGEHVVVLVAGVSLVQLLEVAVDRPPGGLLLVRVLHLWDGLAMFVEEGDIRKLLPPGPVHWVREARVVRVQLGSVGENLVSEPVQVLNFAREPGHGLRVVQDVPRGHLEVA